MTLAEKLLKRQCYPVKVSEGETVHVRSLTVSELRRQFDLQHGNQALFSIGKTLCNPDGSPAYPQSPEEDDATYAARIAAEFAEVPNSVVHELASAITKISTAQPLEKLTKN
jgi:hypothetical protein